MKTVKFLVVALGLISFLCPGIIWAQEGISLAVVTKPGAAQNVCAERFKELLEGRSGHKVLIHDSGKLGTEVEILRKIREGKVRMGIITSGPFDQFAPEARVIDYPYLFASYEQVDAILEGPLGDELLKSLEKAGFKGLSFSENGFRHLTNSVRPVHGLADVAGLRIRVMESALHATLWELFGANPVPIGDLDRLIAKLRSGAVDGQENPLSAIWLEGFYKGQKHLSLTGHVYSSHIGVADLKWFQGLPEKDRKLIRECMAEAARFQRHWSRRNEGEFLRRIRAEGTVVEERPDLDSFRNKASLLRSYPILQAREVRDLLDRFLKATKGKDGPVRH
jgi:tripartite ATP-independent transporter DctP family solute receptor